MAVHHRRERYMLRRCQLGSAVTALMDAINQSLTHYSGLISGLAWGPWLLVLLLGGGTYFLIRTRFLPFRYLGHACALLTNRYDRSDAPGHVSHARALSTALAGTIGMGNIAGVALAIQIGGPGAIFWMWITAIIGMATKFFTCSLAVMYRGQDDRGEVQGGPMYVIRNALPKRWHWLAYMFAAFGMIGSLPVLQTNQLVQAIRESILIPSGVIAAGSDVTGVNLLLGTGIALVAAVVIFGGILRIASVAVRVVPLMGLLYVGAAVLALVLHADQVPAAFVLILHDAFTGEAAAGGSLLAMILYGVR
ncbi:MAG: alanine:cation symporter family protein, partial [Pseudomonadota bacterium]